MRKNIILFCLLLVCSYYSKSQVIFSENFESSMFSMPAGWSQQNPTYIPNNKGWKFDTTVGGTLAPYVPRHSFYAFVNDLDNNNYYTPMHNWDSLFTPSMSFAGYQHIFITYDVWFYGYYFVNPGDFEVASLTASTDGGITWTTVDTVGCWGGHSLWRTVTYNLTPYANMPNVKLAFIYNDGGNQTSGEAIDNIKVYSPVSYDMGVVGNWMWFLCQSQVAYSVQGDIYNFGGDTITAMNLKYSVNNGPAISDEIASLSIPPLSHYYFNHSIPWFPISAGSYTMKIWADSLNGQIDQNHGNDTLASQFVVMDTLEPKLPLFEEFMQASCNPCMLVSPNLDSVLYNNRNNCSPVRYHCNTPARDFMNNVSQISTVGPRINHYGNIISGTGIPDARIDGINDIYPDYVTYLNIQQAASYGSPFTITVNANYDPAGNKFQISAKITAHAAMPAGIRARAIITVDTIKYQQDQSLENPPSSFAPPIGTGSTSDSYYQYVLNYPEVAEQMLPDSNGVRLAAFSSGQSQILNFSWIKNHPWADSGKVWIYDSTNAHVTVFLENDSTPKSGAGAPYKYVYQSASSGVITGLNELLTQQPYVELYPNPARNYCLLVYQASKSQISQIDIYDLLGKKVFTTNNFSNTPGTHSIFINTENLNSGIYLVRIITESGTSVKKLAVTK